MIGYQTDEALLFIQKHIDTQSYSSLPLSLSKLIEQAIQGDLAYMYDKGILDDEGYGGEVFYDEDDAFEYILDYILSHHPFNSEDALLVAVFVNDFMEVQYEFLQEKGLVNVD